jgi:hypothetical protein
MSETSVPQTNYEVPDEPGVYYCARHSKVKTRLRCGRCEKPICPKCTVYGPTGARCPTCASNKSLHIYQVSPAQYAAAAVVAVLLGVISGTIASASARIMGLFALFYAPVAGTIIGKTVGAAARQKRGMPLAIIASAGLFLGAMIPPGAILQLFALGARNPNQPVDVASLLLSNASNPFLWLYLLLAIPSVWYWLR